MFSIWNGGIRVILKGQSENKLNRAIYSVLHVTQYGLDLHHTI